MIQCFSDNNIEPMLLNAAWERNKKVRTKIDWAKIKGAVSDE